MANEQTDNSQASEDAVNAAATAELEQAGATDTAEVVETKAQETSETPTDNQTVPEQPVFDAQKSYSELEKSYNELRKFSTQTAQERAELKRHLSELQTQQKQLLETIQKATEAPFDIEQFKREFEEKGPEALNGYLQKNLESRLGELQSKYDKMIGDLREQNSRLSIQYGVEVRRANTEKYPNFDALYPKMCELAKDPKCPVDMTKSEDEILDGLYALAKSQSSEEAVKIAATEAKKRAEAEIAKESKTTVATGGKRGTTSTPNLHEMKLDDLEKLVIQMHGVADRD